MDYKGFYIDTDLCDHSVLITSKEYGIERVEGTLGRAKAFVDGFVEAVEKLKLK